MQNLFFHRVLSFPFDFISFSHIVCSVTLLADVRSHLNAVVAVVVIPPPIIPFTKSS
jgi:hypothetical protein